MGYEVVEENSNKLKETLINGNKEGADMDKPRICKVLGVEVGERFRIDYPKGMTVWLHINKEGFVVREGGPKNLKIGNSVAWAINHPESIIRKPRWTQQEVERARNLLEVVGDGELGKTGGMATLKVDGKIIYLRKGAFPTLSQEQSVKLSDIASPHHPG